MSNPTYSTRLLRVARNWNESTKKAYVYALGDAFRNGLSEADAFYAGLTAARKTHTQSEQTETPAMVAFAVPSEIGKQLLASVIPDLTVDAKITPLSELHLTLIYFGDATEVTNAGKTRADVLNVIQEFASEHACVLGKISGFGLFRLDDDTRCLYASFDAPALSAFQYDLVHEMDEAEIPFREEHGFVPHITLAYLPATLECDLANLQVPNVEICFEEVVLAWGKEWERVALNPRGENVPVRAENKQQLPNMNQLAWGL